MGFLICGYKEVTRDMEVTVNIYISEWSSSKANCQSGPVHAIKLHVSKSEWLHSYWLLGQSLAHANFQTTTTSKGQPATFPRSKSYQEPAKNVMKQIIKFQCPSTFPGNV